MTTLQELLIRNECSPPQPYPGFDILTEPVDKWTDLNGTDLLQLIYDDPKRWALAQVKKNYFETRREVAFKKTLKLV